MSILLGCAAVPRVWFTWQRSPVLVGLTRRGIHRVGRGLTERGTKRKEKEVDGSKFPNRIQDHLAPENRQKSKG